jgi:hypothetical protein
MPYFVERRQNWNRTIGVERRGAPVDTVFGRPLPDPSRLVDEDFQEAQPTSKDLPPATSVKRPLSLTRRRGNR